jgi:hypothetical protein
MIGSPELSAYSVLFPFAETVRACLFFSFIAFQPDQAFKVFPADFRGAAKGAKGAKGAKDAKDDFSAKAKNLRSKGLFGRGGRIAPKDFAFSVVLISLLEAAASSIYGFQAVGGIWTLF